ncbi:MAG: tellurium resistance protein TerC [Candidatus Pelagibacter sp. TMED253]|jgi:predicted tellurium resistance membrane protein TerC|nr:MAG: tellurium resistance protein TerC [Candidatus Pelagibacter sp. TMED253]|tara:strand:- start:1179 stop:1943 length:765 start_codon:yes stop_codon:yes gene_type:complete
MLENLFTLFFLILLQAVLGFDNLLYISLESKKAPKDQQAMVRKVAIGIAVFFRISLLFILVESIKYFQNPLFSLNIKNIVYGSFNFHSIIVLVGGIFLIYTSIKEISHMLVSNNFDHSSSKREVSPLKLILWIALINLIFSFDSILGAIALTDNFTLMVIAILCGGILMIYLADTISDFLQRNRMYEVLGLFILFVVGIMLVADGGHLAHLTLFNSPITPMSKTTFYFIISILIAIDIVQSKYQKNLLKINNKD